MEDLKDVFLSYRREGADSLAQLLYTRLTNDGYRVFLDVESLRSGKFNEKLYLQIESCKDFVLILPPHGLDRCENSDDWVRLEIEHAIKNKKNIIPVMMRGFEFPDTLPQSISQLPKFNSISANMEYFDAVIEKLESMFTTTLDDKSKYPIYIDPEFPEEDIILYISKMMLGISSADEEKEAKVIQKVYDLSWENPSYGIDGRKALHYVKIRDEEYEIYDVFYYYGEKYAYGIKADVPYSVQQIGAFFRINNDDSVELIFRSDGDQSSISMYSPILSWYTTYRRGLGCVPDLFEDTYIEYLKFALYDMKKLSEDDKKTATYVFNSLTDNAFNRESEDRVSVEQCGEEEINKMKKVSEKILYAHVNGHYRGVAGAIYNGNFFGNRFQGYYAGRKIKSPMEKYEVLDVVPLKIPYTYLVLAYPYIVKKHREYLLETPKFFIIDNKDAMKITEFEKATDGYLIKIIKSYFERFALINMQVKMQLPLSTVFIKDKRELKK